MISVFLENKEDDAEQMLKRINIEEPKEEMKNSKMPLCMTQLIQKLKDNKKIVIGVSIGIFSLGKASIIVCYKSLKIETYVEEFFKIF